MSSINQMLQQLSEENRPDAVQPTMKPVDVAPITSPWPKRMLMMGVFLSVGVAGWWLGQRDTSDGHADIKQPVTDINNIVSTPKPLVKEDVRVTDQDAASEHALVATVDTQTVLGERNPSKRTVETSRAESNSEDSDLPDADASLAKREVIEVNALQPVVNVIPNTESAAVADARLADNSQRDQEEATRVAAPSPAVIAIAEPQKTASTTSAPAAKKITLIAPKKSAESVVAQDRPLPQEPKAMRAAEPIDIARAAPSTPATSEMAVSVETLTPSELGQRSLAAAEQALEGGQTQKAMEALQVALRHLPNSEAARNQLAAIYYGRRQTTDALTVLREGINLNPSSQTLRITAAKLLSRESQPAAALTMLNLWPDHPELEYVALRGALAQQLKSNAIALQSYQYLVDTYGEDGRWWLGLAIATDRDSQSDVAYLAYQKAQQLGGVSSTSQAFVRKRLYALQQRLPAEELPQ